MSLSLSKFVAEPRLYRTAQCTAFKSPIKLLADMVASVSWDKTAKDLFRPTSREFARAALSRVGCGKAVVAAWWTQGIAWAAIDLLPAWILDRILALEAVKMRKLLAKSS